MALDKQTAAMVIRISSNEFEIVGLPNGRQSPSFRWRDEAERWLAQNMDRVGLTSAKHKRQNRPCMCCGKSFASEGIHHRLCSFCRSRGDGGSMGIAATSSGKVRRAAKA